MGTSGLVGQFGAFSAMEQTAGFLPTLLEVALMHFILPAALTLAFYILLKKTGWIRDGDLRLRAID